jgi:hypothetical protein
MGRTAPYAKPEIPFTYLSSVAVTDQHIYTMDQMSQRLTRIKMDYAAEATCEVR